MFFLTALGACHLLCCAGFVLSEKSVLVPSTCIVWLGKLLDTDTGIHNLPGRAAAIFVAIWALRTVACTRRGLQRVPGSIQWLAAPHSLAGPWLAPVYQYLFSAAHQCTVLPIRTWCFLLSAFFLSLVPAKPCRVPPPHTMPLVYSDAAPCGDSFVVACCRPGLAASVASTPTWVASVQDAELYGIFHSLRQCALRRLSPDR